MNNYNTHSKFITLFPSLNSNIFIPIGVRVRVRVLFLFSRRGFVFEIKRSYKH